MPRWKWLRFLLAAGGIGIAGIAACNAFLPERLAVNAPLGHILFGRGAAPPAEQDVSQRFVAFAGRVHGDQQPFVNVSHGLWRGFQAHLI